MVTSLRKELYVEEGREDTRKEGKGRSIPRKLTCSFLLLLPPSSFLFPLLPFSPRLPPCSKCADYHMRHYDGLLGQKGVYHDTEWFKARLRFQQHGGKMLHSRLLGYVIWLMVYGYYYIGYGGKMLHSRLLGYN